MAMRLETVNGVDVSGAAALPDGFLAAAAVVFRDGKASTSHVQRTLGIGYNRAAACIEAMEDRGLITRANPVGKREIIGGFEDHGFGTLGAVLQRLDLPPHPAAPVPMKETAADRAVRDNVFAVTAGELRQFVERYEHLEAEKKEITDQQKEVMSEAKGRGYDTKALRAIIALRKRDPDEVAEAEAVLDLYKSALGMA